jgi:hypothetical protein
MVGNRGNITLEPVIGFTDSEVKLAEIWRLGCIRRCVQMLLAKQVSAKDSVDDVDMVECPDCGV